MNDLVLAQCAGHETTTNIILSTTASTESLALTSYLLSIAAKGLLVIQADKVSSLVVGLNTSVLSLAFTRNRKLEPLA